MSDNIEYKLEDIMETFKCDKETAKDIREMAKVIIKDNIPFQRGVIQMRKDKEDVLEIEKITGRDDDE